MNEPVSEEEYSLMQYEAFKQFMDLVDRCLSSFTAQMGVSDDEFAQALLTMKMGQDPHWRAFDLLLQRVDFSAFAELMRSDTCLCCGGRFALNFGGPDRLSPRASLPPLQAPAGDTDAPSPWQPEALTGQFEVEVTVPPGVGEGDLVAVDYNGILYQVAVPPGYGPGDPFRVALEASSPR